MSTINKTTALYTIAYLDDNHHIIDTDKVSKYSEAIELVKASQEMDVNNLIGINEELATREDVLANETPCPVLIIDNDDLTMDIDDYISEFKGDLDLIESWIID